MMNRKVLLFVDVWPKMFVVHRMALAKAMLEKGYAVHVAAPDGSEREVIAKAGCVFHVIPLDRRSINPFRELKCVWALVRLMRALRPTVVHAMRLKPIIYGGVAARLAKTPAIVYGTTGLGYAFTGNDMRTAPLRIVVKQGFRVALGHPNCRILVENPDDEGTLLRRGVISAGMARVIKGVGVDLKEYPLLPEAEGVPVVVFASRMLWDKGVGEFVCAAERLKAQGVQARFVLVGDTDPGNRSAVPTKQLDAWKESGIVEWWGWRNDMVAVFSAAHVVCLPSFYREGVPHVLIKAAACGRAIVTTDAPGCREIVHHGRNGLLVPVKDAGALAVALKTVIESPAMRLDMGLNGRALVAREFTQEYVNNATLRVYRELLA
jgi:glycosyltransferase involved in cell wall biosynthesis